MQFFKMLPLPTCTRPEMREPLINCSEHRNVSHLVEHDAIGFQHVVFLSGVEPPAS